jgi:NADPH-dependent 2,4-dienoyl-CoA reductase/sulfur reductase-like enzyme/rhodanese-related sulfurtransferase
MNKTNKTIVVIGGVAGGMSFATRYRRLHIEDHIIVFEKGPYVSFANCGLPYFMSGEITSRSRLLVVKEKDLIARFNLDIRLSTEVISIDAEAKTVTFIKEGVEGKVSYDELVLSPGAKPIIPVIEGIETIPHFELRNIPHLDKIMMLIKEKDPKKVVVVGGGYIGLEVAENLHKRGIHVSIIEKGKAILPVFDEEIAYFAHQELVKQGLAIYKDDEIVKVDHHSVHLRSGKVIDADFIMLAVGVLPESTLAKASGITLGLRGGILVDHHYQTNLPHVYAIGDAIVVKHTVSGLDSLVPLASPANRQGRQLADILSGLPVVNKGSLGTAIVRLFDLTFASTGLNEKQLAGQSFQSIHVNAYDHVSYYPGATKIDLKVIYDPKTEMILGAQAVGAKGVDKRIDILSVAIKAKMKVSDLQELELTYSPPFGAAKDIVNIAGYVAQNHLLGLTKSVSYKSVDALKAENAYFLDVRPIMERMAYGHIEGDHHLDIDELSSSYQTIPKDRNIIVYCDTGSRGYNAERFLRSKGYDVKNIEGAYNMYATTKGNL